jgi:AcrR family transcriptional regulator
VPAGPKQVEQSEITRRRLIRAARRLYGRKGYAGTSIEDVVRAAKVTRGALYHHFANKRELFRAVYEQLAEELATGLTEAAQAEPRPELHLEIGCHAFLDACVDHDVRQILILDAPAVLGVEIRDEINARHARGMLTLALSGAMENGYLREQAVEPLAYLLLGALEEAGLQIARAEDVNSARDELAKGLQGLLDGLKTA